MKYTELKIKELKDKINACGLYAGDGGHNGDEIDEALSLLSEFSEQLKLYSVVKSLPIRKYEIDFGGDLKCGLEITPHELNVIGAMNGWGNGVNKKDIVITTL